MQHKTRHTYPAAVVYKKTFSQSNCLEISIVKPNSELKIFNPELFQYQAAFSC